MNGTPYLPRSPAGCRREEHRFGSQGRSLLAQRCPDRDIAATWMGQWAERPMDTYRTAERQSCRGERNAWLCGGRASFRRALAPSRSAWQKLAERVALLASSGDMIVLGAAEEVRVPWWVSLRPLCSRAWPRPRFSTRRKMA